MEHETSQHEVTSDLVAATPAVGTTASDGTRPEAVLVEPAVWDAAQSQILVLESRVARAEEENRAFMQSLRHAAAAAEELLDEARVEAASMRSGAERDVAKSRALLDQRHASLLVDAQRDAAALLDQARAVAHEIVVVARADAREAVLAERRRAAEELAVLAVVRERIADERRSLTEYHAQLAGRLRPVLSAISDFVTQAPAAAPDGPATFSSTVLTGPQIASAHLDVARDVATPAAPTPTAVEPSLFARDEEHLDRAFEEFFSGEVDDDPSRRWILED